jgi:hypothetical protein
MYILELIQKQRGVPRNMARSMLLEMASAEIQKIVFRIINPKKGKGK